MSVERVLATSRRTNTNKGSGEKEKPQYANSLHGRAIDLCGLSDTHGGTTIVLSDYIKGLLDR
jgi:hypothetical protein